MKRYLVFAGPQCYPEGGAKDYVMSFTKKEEAVVYCRTLAKRRYSWAHCWDTKADVVEEFYDHDVD